MVSFDVGDSADDAEDEPEESATEETPTESEPSPIDETPEPDSSDEPEPVRERDPTETGPSFPYSEVKQSPLYAHEDVWTEFEDQIDRSVVPDLRDMEIRDDELREIHTVALEIVLDNLDEIPDRLAERRRHSR